MTASACSTRAPGRSSRCAAAATATLTRAAAGVRLWAAELALGGRPVLDYLAEHGAPIRYAHDPVERPLGDYQTIFARVPGSAEMPSAGRPFTPRVLHALAARGVGVARLVLHTGVSSLEAGEPPYAEHFSVPASTAAAVNAAHRAGRRVIAVGTTVTRALESAATPDGIMHAGRGLDRPRRSRPSAASARSTGCSRAGTSPRRATCCCSRRSPGARSSSAPTPRRSRTATAGTSSATRTSCCLDEPPA